MSLAAPPPAPVAPGPDAAAAVSGALATVAAGLMASAMARSGGHYNLWSLAELAVALPLALAAALWRGHAGERPAWHARLVPALLTVALAVELVLGGRRRPGLDLVAAFSMPLYQASLGVVALVAASYWWEPLCPRRLRLPLAVGIFGLLGLWVIRSSPLPSIDTWSFQQLAAERLLHGVNPYSTTYPNPYGDDRYFGPGLVRGTEVLGYPYPPASLLASALGWLAGDVRWAGLAALVGAGALLGGALRRLGARPGHPAELAVVAALFHPKALVVLERAWIDPLLALAMAWLVFCLAGRRAAGLATAGAAALVLSAKQYGLVLLPALWAARRLTLRVLVGAGLLAGLLALPFALWDLDGFVFGVIRYPFMLWPRPDSLSFATLWWAWTGRPPAGWVGPLAALLVAGAVALRFRRVAGEAPLHQALAGSATSLLCAFAANKTAFLNYYWLIGVLLMGAAGLAAVAAAPEPAQGEEPAAAGAGGRRGGKRGRRARA